tara:strand:- start:22910 stop:23272 length:363 start_codon:yes stop_codon:yes gene_type:complete
VVDKPNLISIDFDGTIVVHDFPRIGEPMPHAFEVMKELQEAGFKLILNTCREDHGKKKYLTEAVEFCKKHGVEFRSVNETRLEDEFRPEGGRKVYAKVYIDDRNLGGFPGWLEVKKILLD